MHIVQKRKAGISVIIPTFNRSVYLYSTLLLLLNQDTGKSIQFEIIVIDSGNDDTGKIVKLLTVQYPGIIIYRRIKNCKNRSLLRNTGAELSKYDTLLFLDNDILVPKNFIRTHYEIQKETNHLVLLGRRRSLTAFNIDDIGEEALCNDFNFLEKLPWYEDERMFKTFNNQLWRYVFSHSISLPADDFFKSGMFNKKFGSHWGFEDLELGFKLMNIGCNFRFLQEICTYHQPHFNQSNTEQHESLPNQQLFIKLHNCFAVELYVCFYSQFDALYQILESIPFVLPDRKLFRKYDLILGCLLNSECQIKSNKMFLGAYIPKRDCSCRNIFILKTFYILPHEVQTAIIAEAFRVSKYVDFEEYDETNKHTIVSICNQAGFSVAAYNNKGVLSTALQKKEIPALYSFILPDILMPEKRYVYTWFAYRLFENGYMITLKDMKNAKISKGDDFSLPPETEESVSSLINRCNGFIRGQSINSSAMLLSEKLFRISDVPDNYIIHDEDFILNYKSLEKRGYEHCIHLNDSSYELLSFASIYDIFITYKQNIKKTRSDDSFCCFMENGYLEDGIDIVLKAFSLYLSGHSSAQLSVKVPDYKQLIACCYPLHNDASRKAKTFGMQQKINSDMNRLTNTIEKYRLSEHVIIIQRNSNINEIFNFIEVHDCVVNASRECCTPPQVYASILLQKKTIVAQHQRLVQPFLDYCITVQSELVPFADELEVPLICANAEFSAGRINENDLCRALSEKNRQVMPPEKAKETAELFTPEVFLRRNI
jgi:glycosyltransferase involved in cell wall biosynthesis